MKFNDTLDFIGQGVENIHYINIDWSGSDLVKKIRYYIEHEDEASRIVVNVRAFMGRISMLDNKDRSSLKWERILYTTYEDNQ